MNTYLVLQFDVNGNLINFGNLLQSDLNAKLANGTIDPNQVQSSFPGFGTPALKSAVIIVPAFPIVPKQVSIGTTPEV